MPEFEKLKGQIRKQKNMPESLFSSHLYPTVDKGSMENKTNAHKTPTTVLGSLLVQDTLSWAKGMSVLVVQLQTHFLTPQREGHLEIKYRYRYTVHTYYFTGVMESNIIKQVN